MSNKFELIDENGDITDFTIEDNNEIKNYKNNSPILVFCVLIFLVFTVCSVYFLNKACLVVNQEEVSYKEIGNSDYKVKLKPNRYYDSEYLDKNMSYIASLIDTVNIDFKYNFNTSKEISGTYSYQIIGDLEIVNPDTNELFYTKQYNLMNQSTININNEKNVLIEKPISINYGYYNSLANGFKSTYGVNSVSKLNVYMVISRSVDGLDQLNGSNKIKIEIPLSEKAISIKLSSSNLEKSNSVIQNNVLKSWNMKYIIIGLIMLFIALIDFIYFVIKYRSLHDKMSSYDKALNRTLREYDRLIVNSSTVPELEKYDVTNIDKFGELLDAKENLHKPIYFVEITPHKNCYFYIKNDNELLLFELKESDFNNKK